MISSKVKKVGEGIILYLIIVLVAFFALLPVFWMVKTSFSTASEAFIIPPKLIFQPTLENYRYVVLGGYMRAGADFWRFYGNSVVVSLFSTLLALVIGVPAAYILARFQFRGKDNLSFWILSTRMAPPLGVALPLYILIMKMHLLDTRLGLIILYLTFDLGLVVWMMVGFFQELPRQIEEAAMVDGCSVFEAFWKVVLPLSASGLSAAAILCIVFSWNEFLFALMVTGVKAQTAPVGVYSFMLHTRVMWGPICAAGTLVALPVVAFVVLVQRHLVRALTFGAIKG